MTTARTWTDTVDTIHRRFPSSTVDAVAAAIEAAGLAQSGLTRFVNRLQAPGGADWPTAAMTGDERLAVSPSPGSSLIWIEKSRTAKILIDLLRHGREPAHEDLDALPSAKRADGKADRRQSIENARMILVSIGVLAPRNALAGRYEAWALQVLAKVDQAADRWTLQQFHRHRLLPSVEARCEAGKATRGTVRQVQNQLRAAIELMARSRPRGGLGRRSRFDVDEWLAGLSTRHWARQFLLWAIRQHLLDLPASAIPLPRLRPRPMSRTTSCEPTWPTSSFTKKAFPRTFVSPAFSLSSTVSTCPGSSASSESVDPESTPPRIKLGRNWLELPDPMGRHIAELLVQGPRRRAQFVEDARWLFLGDGAGTHLSSDRLRVRLAEYGIHARSMRNTVLFQLGATVQPKTLARLLDLHASTAMDWVNKADGIYSNYWGQVLRDEEAEDPGLFDPGLEALEEDEDPEDLLDELDLI